MKKICYILILIFLSANLMAQKKNLEKADIFFQKKNYVEAVKFYKRALKKSNSIDEKKVISYFIAQAFQNMNLFAESANYYESAIGRPNDNAKFHEGYADVLARQGKMKKALSEYKKALLTEKNNTKLISKFKKLKFALEKGNNSSSGKIRKQELINSEYSEYGLGWYKDKLIFASTRFRDPKQNIDGRTFQAYSDLYISEFNEETKKWVKPVKVRGSLNSKYNDGSFAFDSKGNVALTMQCNEKSSGCVLIAADYNERGDFWSGKKNLSFNNKKYSFGHPTISKNGDILYFVSNMPGGYGEKDIWKSNRKDDGTWGLPINLGEKINTNANEMFPFILGDTLLFFASDGHFGFGGLDIFYSAWYDFDFSEPQNIGWPFNTSSDDFNMILKDDLSGGLFCSNRDVSNSDEIFSFNGFPLSLNVSGYIYEVGTKMPINDAAIIFTDQNKIIDTVFSNPSGSYVFSDLNAFNSYKIKAIKNGYFDDKRTLNVSGSNILFSQDSTKLSINFSLERKKYAAKIKGKITERSTNKAVSQQKVFISGDNDFSSFTFTDENGNYTFSNIKPRHTYVIKINKKDYFSESRKCTIPDIRKAKTFSKKNGYDMDFILTKIEKKKEIVLNNIYYDFDKARLRDESLAELDKLVSMMKETKNVIIKINSHTDARGSDSYNKRLSDARAKAVVDYLVYCGISQDRLLSEGYGEQKLILTNASTDKEHQANRRTTFSVINILKNSETPNRFSTSKKKSNVSFRIQILVSKEKVDINNYFVNIYNTIPGIEIFVSKAVNTFKYEAGVFYSLEKASKIKKSIKTIGYADCFITSYLNGKKISINKAKDLIK